MPAGDGITKTSGRFSGPDLAYGILYFGANPAACFRESGLGRDLNARIPDDIAIRGGGMGSVGKGTKFRKFQEDYRRLISDGVMAPFRNEVFSIDGSFCKETGVRVEWCEVQGILAGKTRGSRLFPPPALEPALTL